MRKILLTATIFVALLSKPSAARTDGLGVGVILGEPTGASAKKFISHSVAVDGALAWSFIDDGALYLHADMLYHKFDRFNIGFGHLALYYGPGVRMAFARHAWLGARFPVGLGLTMDEHIFEAFFELAPTFDLLPKTGFSLNAGIGARFYF